MSDINDQAIDEPAPMSGNEQYTEYIERLAAHRRQVAENAHTIDAMRDIVRAKRLAGS